MASLNNAIFAVNNENNIKIYNISPVYINIKTLTGHTSNF